MIGLFLVGVTVLQVVVLLLSPSYKDLFPFSIYYKYVFKPLLQDNQRYRWKFYVVPGFYFGLYGFIVHQLGKFVLPAVSQRLFIFEKVLVLPLLIIVTPLLGWLSMVFAPYNSADNLTAVQEYPYDYLLYYPNVKCRTCRVAKPARSRHCSLCGVCVLVADHHCIWVNNCIGKGNYQYFYGFLFANTISMIYGFLRMVHITITRDEVTQKYPKSITLFTILCGSFAVICGVFTFMQLDLVRNGMTTNEKDKWFTLHDILREGRLVATPDNRWFIKSVSSPESEDTIDNDANQFYSTNPYDPVPSSLDNYRVLTDTSEILNIYDSGSLMANFTKLCT